MAAAEVMGQPTVTRSRRSSTKGESFQGEVMFDIHSLARYGVSASSQQYKDGRRRTFLKLSQISGLNLLEN